MSNNNSNKNGKIKEKTKSNKQMEAVQCTLNRVKHKKLTEERKEKFKIENEGKLKG